MYADKLYLKCELEQSISFCLVVRFQLHGIHVFYNFTYLVLTIGPSRRTVLQTIELWDRPAYFDVTFGLNRVPWTFESYINGNAI